MILNQDNNETGNDIFKALKEIENEVFKLLFLY